MKKFFLSICFSILIVGQGWAATREFSDIGEAQADMSMHSKALMGHPRPQEKLPETESELREYLQEREEFLDFYVLPQGEQLNKMSSFSKIEDDSTPTKSVWEKMYDDAISRLKGSSSTNIETLQSTQYYTLNPENADNASEEEQVPAINVQLSDGSTLMAPAYEHIPYFSTQIEVLSSRLIKVSEEIVVVANGQKVRELLSRFIKKEHVSGKGKIQVVLDEVFVNGALFPYELVELNDYYVIRPAKQVALQEGVYIFEINYLVDRYLWDIGDFYEFYWDLTGGHFNLLITKAIASIKLPGREPAVKQFAITGNAKNLQDNNSAYMLGKNNTIGFMNLYPLLNGESMRLFLTVPKVDFLPLSTVQKMVSFLELYGDILICGIYLMIAIVSCLLSWRYIRKSGKLKNVTLSSAVLVRALWRGGADMKSTGCLLLDLFRKNIIDIESQNGEVILVRKTVHSRHETKFEKAVLRLLFPKKDRLSRLSSGKTVASLKTLIRKESEKQVKRLGLKLAGLYIFSNIFMLLLIEAALVFWNPQALMAGILGLVDACLLLAVGVFHFARESWWRKYLFSVLFVGVMVLAALLLKIYLSWSAVILFLSGFCVALLFTSKTTGTDAMLKTAVQSAYQMRDFLLKQKEHIGSGRNFNTQQANIFALDLEDDYPNNDKIKTSYRLNLVARLLGQIS